MFQCWIGRINQFKFILIFISLFKISCGISKIPIWFTIKKQTIFPPQFLIVKTAPLLDPMYLILWNRHIFVQSVSQKYNICIQKNSSVELISCLVIVRFPPRESCLIGKLFHFMWEVGIIADIIVFVLVNHAVEAVFVTRIHFEPAQYLAGGVVWSI